MYCKYVQWRLSCHLDSQTEPTGLLNRHLQNCPRCRQQYQRMRQICQQLTVQNPDFPNFEEEKLRQKILSALPKSRFCIPASQQQRRRLATMPAAGLAAAVLIIAALWWLRPNPTPPTYDEWVQFNQFLSMKINSFGEDLVRQSMHRPMEKEWSHVTHDVQKAVRFFTNCLPATGEKPPTPSD